MKIEVSAVIIAMSMIVASPVLAAPQPAATVTVKPSQQYRELPAAQIIPSNQVEVIEFFSFACPHCAHLEPTLQSWRKTMPKGVVFRRVPVVFRPQWEILAKVY